MTAAENEQLADRSAQAEGCEALVDLIDDWVRGESSETTAERILEWLPEEIQEALRAHCYQSELMPWRAGYAGASGEGELIEDPLVEFGDPPTTATIVEPVDEQEITLVITSQSFDPSYDGWNVQFQAIGAPRLAHQSSDPSLEAWMKLEVVDTSRQLTAGGSTALALDDEPSRHALRPLTGTTEGNLIASALGAASIDTGTVKEVPLALPSEAELVAVMQKSLEAHLKKVCEERARLKITEGGEAFVGKSFKVRS